MTTQRKDVKTRRTFPVLPRVASRLALNVWLCVLVGLSPASTALADEAAPQAWNLEQLMQQRSHIKSERARFVEVRRTPSADLATTTEGVLIYEAPDRLERQTSTPFPQRAVVQGERMALDIETASGQHVRRDLALADVPGLRLFFAALRALLAGDLAALQQTFEIKFSGTESDWRLTLVPLAKADRHVRDIVITGRAAELLSMDVNERNGDSSRTTLTPEAPTPAAPPSPAAPPTPNGAAGS